jgi:hypothetical protein
VEAAILAFYGPIEEKGANLVRGGGRSGISSGSFSMAAKSTGDIIKVVLPVAGQTGPGAGMD